MTLCLYGLAVQQKDALSKVLLNQIWLQSISEAEGDLGDCEFEPELELNNLVTEENSHSEASSSRSFSTGTSSTSANSDVSRDWCEFFHKHVTTGSSKSTSRYVRYNICIQHPSVVAMHC